MSSCVGSSVTLGRNKVRLGLPPVVSGAMRWPQSRSILVAIVFVISKGADEVTDFVPGADLIDTSGLTAVTEFADLTIAQTAAGALIGLTVRDTLLLTGVSAAQLSADDFLF